MSFEDKPVRGAKNAVIQAENAQMLITETTGRMSFAPPEGPEFMWSDYGRILWMMSRVGVEYSKIKMGDGSWIVDVFLSETQAVAFNFDDKGKITSMAVYKREAPEEEKLTVDLGTDMMARCQCGHYSCEHSERTGCCKVTGCPKCSGFRVEGDK